MSRSTLAMIAFAAVAALYWGGAVATPARPQPGPVPRTPDRTEARAAGQMQVVDLPESVAADRKPAAESDARAGGTTPEAGPERLVEVSNRLGMPAEGAELLSVPARHHAATRNGGREAVPDLTGARPVATTDGSGRARLHLGGASEDPVLLVARHPAGIGWSPVPSDGPVRIRLRPTAALTIGIVSPGGLPRPGTRVTALPLKVGLCGDDPERRAAGRLGPFAEAWQAHTDPRGRVRLEHLPCGHDGASWRLVVETVEEPRRRALLRDVELHPDRTTSLRIVFHADSAEALRGVVRDTGGLPVPDATVQAGSSSARTDASGAFRLDETYRYPAAILTIRAAGYSTCRHRAAADGPLVVVLHRAVPLRGRVLEDGSGRPVADAEVVVSGDGIPPQRVRSDATGSFRFEGCAAGRWHLLRAKRRGGVPAPTAAVAERLTRPEDGEVTLRLPEPRPVTALEVTLLTEDGEPLTPRRWQLRSLDQPTAAPAGQLLRGSTGRLTTTKLPAGQWGLRVEADQGAPLVHRFDTTVADSPRRLTLRQPRPRRVTVELVGAATQGGRGDGEPRACELRALGGALRGGGLAAARRVPLRGGRASLRIDDLHPDEPLILLATAGDRGGLGILEPGRERLVVTLAPRATVVLAPVQPAAAGEGLRRQLTPTPRGGSRDLPPVDWRSLAHSQPDGSVRLRLPAGSWQLESRLPATAAGTAARAAARAGFTVAPGELLHLDAIGRPLDGR